MLKKRYLFLIIIICLFTISTVSAEDNATRDIISEGNNVNSLEANSVNNNMNSIVKNANDTLKEVNDELLTVGHNWYVNESKNSSGDGKSETTAFKSLNEAINNASDNDTIIIASGEYKGTNNINLMINKNLNFMKLGDGEVIFNAEGLSRIWTVTATSINITGLIFKNGKANGVSFKEELGGAIYFKNKFTNSNINAIFINNTATYGGGAISIFGGFSGNLSGTFVNNTAGYGGAISIWGDVSGNLSGTYINNTATYSGAIYISGVSGNLNGTFINAKYVTKYYGGSEKFVVNITDDKGSPIINKSVKITINGITYNKTTDSKGIASLNIKLSSGTYGVTTCVDNITLKSRVTVLSTVIGKDITKYYKNATQYSVQLYDTNGKAVGAGEFVTFNVNGVFYKRVTDKNGIATLNINLPPSNYVITADYKGCKISNNIKVLPVLLANDITMKYMDGTQFKVNLVDGQGKLYKEQFVRFNINGRFYDRLIDNNRVAALNIRLIPGEYIITSSFNGCNIANKITITS